MKIGKIISVEYDKFKVKLFHTTKHSTVSIDGYIYYFGNIGSYLKTVNSVGECIICEVESILDYDKPSSLNSQFNLDSSRELVIKPIGTIRDNVGFSMGVGIFPSLYSDVEIVTVQDLDKILARNIEVKDGIHTSIELGISKNLINYNLHIGIDNLFNIHTAVLGNSGSGKSNTIAHILQEVYRKAENHAEGSKTILFDVNGEYDRAFIGANLYADVEVVSYKPNAGGSGYTDFYLPYYLMTLDEWLAFLMASQRTQKPFWDKVLQQTYKFYKIFSANSSAEQKKAYVNYFKWKILFILGIVLRQVDSDTARMTAARSIIISCRDVVNNTGGYRELLKFLNNAETNCGISYGDNNSQLATFIKDELDKVDVEEAMRLDSDKLKTGEYYDYSFLSTAVELTLLEEEARGNTSIREYTSTMLSRLDYFLHNEDCDFMRLDNAVFSNEEDYMQKMLGIGGPKREKQLILINSSEIGTDVLELMTSVISRMIFDYRKHKSGDERRKQPVHLILDEAHRYIKKDATYIIQDNIFEKIAREGRKYSLFLMISSQRPSELSSTVLSQCGNYIVHRIQNEVDMKYIYSVLPYFSDSYTTKIKQQVPGEALVFGNCVPMPLQVKVIQAQPDPNSKNCEISKEWFTLQDKEQVNGNDTSNS